MQFNWGFRDVVFQDVGFQNAGQNSSTASALGVKSPHVRLLRVNQPLFSNPISSNTTSLSSRYKGGFGKVNVVVSSRRLHEGGRMSQTTPLTFSKVNLTEPKVDPDAFPMDQI